MLLRRCARFRLETAEEMRVRAAKKPAQAKAGAAPPVDPPPLLANTLGVPLPTPFTLAAQLQVGVVGGGVAAVAA